MFGIFKRQKKHLYELQTELIERDYGKSIAEFSGDTISHEEYERLIVSKFSNVERIYIKPDYKWLKIHSYNHTYIDRCYFSLGGRYDWFMYDELEELKTNNGPFLASKPKMVSQKVDLSRSRLKDVIYNREKKILLVGYKEEERYWIPEQSRSADVIRSANIFICNVK